MWKERGEGKGGDAVKSGSLEAKISGKIQLQDPAVSSVGATTAVCSCVVMEGRRMEEEEGGWRGGKR